MKRLAIIGAGSWGTALSVVLAPRFESIRLWIYEADLAGRMAQTRENDLFLPGFPLPANVDVTNDIPDALQDAELVLSVMPSRHVRRLYRQMLPHLEPGMCFVSATKGIESGTLLRMSEVIQEVAGERFAPRVAALSGPTFAREVGAGLPTAMTIASRDADYAEQLAHDFSTPAFRAYTSTDIVGVEVGGAVKNVLAIGAGLSDGLGFGANSRIALITRGLVEMTRLGVALGAQRETFMGLAGLGDLVLTCTDDQSRNRRFGLLLARGMDCEAARAAIGQSVEGYVAARALHEVAQREGVTMPICAGIHGVLYSGLPADEVVRGLMMRPIRPEFD